MIAATIEASRLPGSAASLPGRRSPRRRSVAAAAAVATVGLLAQATPAHAQAKAPRNAGPIWNQADANGKCPKVCAPPASWSGGWWTTVPGKMSVCECVEAPPPPPPPPPPQPAKAPRNAGPIWNQADANGKCPRVCAPPASWSGGWWTTVPGRMSVCECVEAPPPPPPPPPPQPVKTPRNAGPIWNQADANRKCPRVCAPPERWSGGWWTTVPGRMSVCECVAAAPPPPPPPPPEPQPPPPPPAEELRLEEVTREPGESCPAGKELVTYDEAVKYRDGLCKRLQQWDIARLAGGAAMDGPGYQCQQRPSDGRKLGNALCKRAVVAPPPPVQTKKVPREAGPIWNQADATRKCPRVCAAPARWSGGWWTTVPNRMSVCECLVEEASPTPAPGEPTGQADPELAERIVAAWQGLPGSPNGCPDFDYFPNGGMRNFHCHVAPRFAFADLARVAGVPVFLSGPHGADRLNFESPRDFGRYNPEFVRRLRAAVATTGNPLLRGQLQPIYDQFMRPLARVHYLAWRALVSENRLAAETAAFQQALSTGQTAGFYGRYEGLVANQDPNVVATAGAFWVRRAVDGTAREFAATLEALLALYDAAFLAQNRVTGTP